MPNRLKRFSRRLPFTGFLVLALAVSPLACSGPADAGRVLKVCTSMDEDRVLLYLAELRRVHPELRVELTFIDENGLADVLAMPESERPDVAWSCSAVELVKAAGRGELAEFAPPNLAELRPEFYDRSGDIPRWLGFCLYVNAFAASAHDLARSGMEPPRALEDLLQPRYRNGIVALDPERTGTGFMFVAGVLRKMGEREGWDYLDTLHTNIKYYTDEPAAPVKQAGRDSCQVGISSLHRCVTESRKGAVIKAVIPEAAGWDIMASGIVKKSETHPQAAKFMEWTVSRPMMTVYARHFPEVALRDGGGMDTSQYTADGKPWSPGANIAADLEWTAARKKSIIDQWRWRKYADKLRREAKSFSPRREATSKPTPRAKASDAPLKESGQPKK